MNCIKTYVGTSLYYIQAYSDSLCLYITGCITALEQLAHHQSHYAQFWLDLANAYYQYSHSEGESISYNFQVRIVTCYIRARFVFLLNDNYFVIIISIDLYSVPEIPQQHEMYVNQFRYSP